MTDKDLIERALRDEVIGDGQRQLRLLADRLETIWQALPALADDLVDAQNQLHRVRHGAMAKRTIALVEQDLRRLCEDTDG